MAGVRNRERFRAREEQREQLAQAADRMRIAQEAEAREIRERTGARLAFLMNQLTEGKSLNSDVERELGAMCAVMVIR